MEDKILKNFEKKSDKNAKDRVKECLDIPEIKELYGKYLGFERKEGIYYFIQELETLSTYGFIPKGHPLYCTRGYAKNLITLSNTMNEYVEDRFDGVIPREELTSDDLQSFLNLKKINEKGKENSLETIQQYVFRLQKINLIENLAYHTDIDYSASLAAEEPTRENKKDIRNVAYTDADAEKLIDISHKNNYTRNTDVAVGIDLSYFFGLRLDTTMKLTLGDIDLKKMEIRVPKEKNKGKIAYVVKAGTDEEKRILREIVVRAENKYYKLVEDRKDIPLTTIKEKGMHLGFRRYEERAGIGNFYKIKNTSFHALRKNFAQKMYDTIRVTKNDLPIQQAKDETLLEVSKLLGHGKKVQRTLNSYISSFW